MPGLLHSLHAWQTDAFAATLKKEIEGMGVEDLPLDEGTAQGGFVDDSKITATVLCSSDQGPSIHAEVGVFFTEIVAGCSCGDEPESINAYCRIQIRIDKETGRTKFSVISDQ